jgi:hypothetical protein
LKMMSSDKIIVGNPQLIALQLLPTQLWVVEDAIKAVLLTLMLYIDASI